MCIANYRLANNISSLNFHLIAFKIGSSCNGWPATHSQAQVDGVRAGGGWRDDGAAGGRDGGLARGGQSPGRSQYQEAASGHSGQQGACGWWVQQRTSTKHHKCGYWFFIHGFGPEVWRITCRRVRWAPAEVRDLGVGGGAGELDSGGEDEARPVLPQHHHHQPHTHRTTLRKLKPETKDFRTFPIAQPRRNISLGFTLTRLCLQSPAFTFIQRFYNFLCRNATSHKIFINKIYSRKFCC